MSIQNQIATMHGSMNQDNVGQHVRTDQGQVVERVNLRVNSKGGKKLYNEKLLGNVLVPAALPTGVNKVVGWKEDYENDAIIYFVYNSNGNHSIMRYYVNTKEIERIWYAEKSLGLEDKNLRASVVDGMLYWVQEGVHPKALNIQMAVNYMKYLGGEPTDERYTVDDKPFEDNIFPMIKRPPRYAPQNVEYHTDGNYNFNNLRKKQFQFKYCWEYSNYQRSAWSPISKVPLPQNEISSIGKWVTDITTNNHITLEVDTGTSDVRKILVAARDCSPENAGSFFLFMTIDKEEDEVGDSEEHVVSFYNNKQVASVNTDIDNRYFDNIPLSASDILLLDGKHLLLSRPEIGYPEVVVDYDLSCREISEDIKVSFVKMEVRCEKNAVPGPARRAYVAVVYLPEVFYANSVYRVTFEINSILYDKSFLTGDNPTENYPSDMRDDFIEDIRLMFGHAAANNRPGSNQAFQLEIDELAGAYRCGYVEALKGTIALPNGEFSPTFKTLKRGQFHPFGIIYNDGFGRYNIVFSDKDGGEVYSPLYGTGVMDKFKRVVCDWSINSSPPEDAVTYRWCYIKKKSYLYFIYVPNVRVTPSVTTEDGSNGVPQGKFLLDINKSLQDLRELFPNTVIPDYIWENGDRLRVLWYAPQDGKSYEILCEYTAVPDDETAETMVGFLIDADIRNFGNFVRMVEIYRPNPEPQENIYFEIGEEFPIITDSNGYRCHGGNPDNGTDQIFDDDGNLLTPATGTFDFGDVYFKPRYSPSFGYIPVEDENYCDYYISNSIDLGRPGSKTKSEQKILNSIIHSENFIENTEYNCLNVFLPESSRFDASDIYGKITGVEEVGGTLKVIQEHKEISVVVGQVTQKDADAGDYIYTGDGLFGAYRRYIEARGTKYRNSLVLNDRYLYYFDVSTGEMVRSSANGQLPISSKYHMRNWFENKSRAFREYTGHKDIIVSCFNDYEETSISFIMGDEIETVVFSEEEFDNGWKYFATYRNDTNIPENFGFIGDTTVSWMNGQLYLHNTGEHNNFYGKQHGCYIKASINVPGGVSKRFANIYINSNRNDWDVEFTTEDRVNYGPQKSILKPSIIKEVNGRLHSDILKNIIKRDGVTEDISALYSGHDLVGEVLFVKLSNEDSDNVLLGEIEVKFHINW